MPVATLGSQLHEVRKIRGLSLKAVADPAGLSAAYLQKLERDEVESPSPHRLHRLAEVLDLDYGELLRLVGYPVPQVEERVRGRTTTPATPVDLTSSKGSLLRQVFQSEERVSDEELEQLARYLVFLREQRRAR